MINYFAFSMAVNFSILWFGWLLGFVVIELIALRLERGKQLNDYNGGTLSELIWRLTRKEKPYWFRILAMIVFAGLWIVLTYHFWFWRP